MPPACRLGTMRGTLAQIPPSQLRLQASRNVTLKATAPSANETAYKRDLSTLMQVLEEDSPNLFSEQGMDLSIYANNVDFRDPITKYDDIQGFKKNLEFLKDIFDPTYEMLGIRQVSETAVEARWTMGFDVLPVTKSPLGKFWTPKLEFTGTTVYGIDEQTGLINLHLDTWDCVKNQDYFSVEAFQDVLSQIFNFQRTPDIPTPQFTVLQKRKNYSIRRYQPFVVAEVKIADATRGEDRTAAFRSLARYLFGGNESSSKMQMTTPVISSAESMQFVLPVESVTDAPQPPSESGVTLRQEPGSVFAVLRYSGQVDEELRVQKRKELLAFMAEDGLEPQVTEQDGGLITYTAQYNDPRVKPLFRRNEVLVAVTDFDVWQKSP